MATFTLRRFSSPDALRAIRCSSLLELLKPYAEYFKRRGLALRSGRRWKQEIDYSLLTHILMKPDEHVPQGLVDDLYFIHEMATPQAMDALVSAVESAPSSERPVLDICENQTPAELALMVRLRAPELLERTHAELMLTRKRSFEYFQSRLGAGAMFTMPESTQLEKLQAALDTGFVKLKRGGGARVFIYNREQEVSFLVRHGLPFKREGAITERGSESVYYRPETHDVLRFNTVSGELSVNAETKTICRMYRELFGYYVFGDRFFFPGTNAYTLEPLRRDGEATLFCSDVPGMEWVRLRELSFFWGGPEGELEVRRASDLFAAFKRRGWKLSRRARLTRASFTVKFAGSRAPRTVTIRPSNIASFTRDADAVVVEKWMLMRGFTTPMMDDDEQLVLPMAHA